MLLFNDDCVSAVKTEIEKQLKGDKAVTRKTVVLALGFAPDKDKLAGAELAISAMFQMGLLPEYKTLQKLGIKPVSYVSKRQLAKNNPPKRTRKKKEDSDI